MLWQFSVDTTMNRTSTVALLVRWASRRRARRTERSSWSSSRTCRESTTVDWNNATTKKQSHLLHAMAVCWLSSGPPQVRVMAPKARTSSTSSAVLTEIHLGITKYPSERSASFVIRHWMTKASEVCPPCAATSHMSARVRAHHRAKYHASTMQSNFDKRKRAFGEPVPDLRVREEQAGRPRACGSVGVWCSPPPAGRTFSPLPPT